MVMADRRQVDALIGFKYKGLTEIRPTEKDFFIDHYAFRIRFDGCLPDVQAEGLDPLPHYVNYFYGDQSEEWQGRVPVYAAVRLNELYPGIDLIIEGSGRELKYSFILAPGAQPEIIRMRNEPGTRVKREGSGRLRIETPLGPVFDDAPLAWTLGSEKREIACRWLVDKGSFGFKLLDSYPIEDTLIIDPVLSFASYSGSTADNWGYTATYDDQGFLYTGGIAFSTGFPVSTGAYQVNFANGACDIAISKYDTSGGYLIYSTYLGGSGTEVPSSLIVNNTNELVLLGTTGSSDFPVTTGAYDVTFNGGLPYTLTSILGFSNGADIILARFSPDGSSLLSSTFFGGSGNDGLNMYSPLKKNYADEVRGEVIIDAQDNIYVVSSTTSTNLPVSAGVFQPIAGGDIDAFVAKFSRDMAVRIWASYAGGSGKDAGYSITLGSLGQIYFAGGTNSMNLPCNGFQPGYGGGTADGFVYRISADAQTLQSATYFGSAVYDQAYFVETDASDRVYLLGQTEASGSTFIHNVSWSQAGGGQFICRLSPDLASRHWSTAWGTGNGGPDISPTAFMVDVCGNIYLSGWGGPQLNGFGGTIGLPLSANALYATTDNNDYYFLVIDKDVTQPLFATFYGGTSSEHVDGGTSRFDRRGIIYQAVCAGCGGSDNFPTTTGAWSNVNGSSNCNNAVIKLDFNLPLVIAGFSPLPSGCVPYTIQFNNTSKGVAGSTMTSQWDFGDGGTSTTFNATHTYTTSGVFPVKLVVGDTAACNDTDTLTRWVVVLSGVEDTLPPAHVCLGSFGHIGLPPSPDTSVSYTWTPATGLSDPNVPNPVVTGNLSQWYRLVVDNGICADTLHQQYIVHEVDVDLGPDTSICQNQIVLNAWVNKPGMTFHWSSKPDFSDMLNTNAYADSLEITLSAPMDIYLRVSDGYCEAEDHISLGFLVISSPVQVQQPSCAGYCDGLAVAQASGGTAPYSFVWSDGQLGDTANGLCAGSYSLTITDAQGCVSISQVGVEEPEQLLALSFATNIPCEEACIGTIHVQVSGGTPPFDFLWDDGQTSSLAQGLCSGMHTVKITDSLGCESFASDTVSVDWVFEGMVLNPPSDTIFRGQSLGLFATPLPGISYHWSPEGSVVDPGAAITEARPQENITYIMLATDGYGCTWLDSIEVVVLDVICREPYIFVPNAFTPNGDNLNDMLYVRSSVAASIEFMIFNRWGEKVFETNNQEVGWDGTFRGRQCDRGVYVYHLEVTCYDLQIFESKGNITLIR